MPCKVGNWISSTFIITVGIFTGMSSQSSEASTLRDIDTWNYAIDSNNDAIDDDRVGGGISEIYGMAYAFNNDHFRFAVNTNFPFSGIGSHWAQDGFIEWADLLLNFSGQNHDTASNNGLLHAIRFSPHDPGSMGVYTNVTAKSIAYENGLLLYDRSLRGYNNYVTNHGGNPSMGDLSAYNPYFSQDHHVQNVINSGTKVADVEVISDIASLGLDFKALLNIMCNKILSLKAS